VARRSHPLPRNSAAGRPGPADRGQSAIAADSTGAASAGSEQEFFTRLDRAGVLARKRFSVKNPGQVTGYAVALPGDTGKDGELCPVIDAYQSLDSA
jgi:hypothetical protein